MGIFDLFKRESLTTNQESEFERACQNLEQGLAYRKLALEIASDLVGNTVARVDWKQFVNDTKVKKSVSYHLNTAPNELETATEFFKHYVKKIFYEGECLIVPDLATGNLYIAESFNSEIVGRGERRFSNIMYHQTGEVDKRTYNNSEVIYLEYNKNNIRSFMNSYLNDYEKIVKSAVGSYRSNKTRRFVLTSKMFTAQTNENVQKLNKQFTENLATFVSSDDTGAVYAKGVNWEIEDYSDKQIESAKDSRDLINDIFGIVAQTYHIPVQMILTGLTGVTITENIIENYLLNVVFPIVDLFKEGYNKFNYSEKQYLAGSRVEPDTSKVRLTNLQTLGTFIASVYPTGALSLNDIVTEYLQLTPLDEELGNTRVITKNYATIEDFKAGLVNNVAPQPTNDEKGDNTNGA